MKKILNLQILLTLVLIAVAPMGVMADTVLFSFNDNFSNGSTTNGFSICGGSPAASYTSYDVAATKNTIPGANGVTIVPNDFRLALAAPTTSGFVEAQALFVTNSVGGTNAIALSQIGDYIDISVVFTNTPETNAASANIPVSSLLAGGAQSFLWLGLFNSGGNAPYNVPVPGALAQSGLTTASGSTNATLNCADWQGYIAQISNGGVSRTTTRPLQHNGGTTSANQELFGNNVGGGAFNNPGATVIETVSPVAAVNLTSGGQYTMELRLTLNGQNSLMISNYLYNGAGTGGTVVFSQGSATGITNATFLTGAFDGFAIGVMNKGTSIDPTMDISSISITGQSTVITTPPTITSQPVPVTVATNGSCVFSVSGVGFNVTYQWSRNGTNLLNQGNISGATGSGNSSTLVVSPAGTNDILSAANGYYVIVSGAGGFSTNSVTNSLALVAAKNLIWTDDNPNNVWDLNNTFNWKDANNNPTVFNYGDSVTFDDTGTGGLVTLTGPYLSAASVTVNSSFQYNFSGSGSFAGPGNLIYIGPAQLTIGNANSYSGGTIISNASAKLLLNNYNGLGTGPVTLALGGSPGLEIGPAGNATLGINGDIVVANDFTIQFDGLGAFAGVFLGNLSGTTGKTLTLNQNPGNTTTNNRVRVYGGNTTNNANLVLNSPLLTFAPYNSSGSQTYNGVISGSGAIMQKGATTYLNGANTYSGGTFPVSAAIGLGIDSVGSPVVTSGPIGTGHLLLTVDSTTTLTGNGQVFASGGSRTIANPIQYTSGTNNLTLVIGGTNNLTFTGPFTLNGNDLITTNSFTNRTVQITNTALTTFSGVISDLTNGVSAAYGLTITGNGTNATGPLALNNTETYTGPTVVSGGTLQVNGSLNAASAVTVNSNATLAGTGTIFGPVTVNPGGALAPGAASPGTLHINNNLTLSGNMKVRVNRAAPGSPYPNTLIDQLFVSGALTNAGTGVVTVTNLGAVLQIGDAFTLFNKPLTNGAALTISGAGMSWANNLAIDGSIAVLGTFVLVPTNSARITGFSLASGNAVINGTNGQSGGTYYLLASTNVAAPLSQWTAVATNIVNTNGASGAFTFTGTNAASPGAGQQFYILSNTNN